MRWALKVISDNKSLGSDNIPIELVKNGGEKTVKAITGLCQKIWATKEWPIEWKYSVYVPLPKKGDLAECRNYRTIALISQCSKVLLKIIQKRLELYVERELPDEQAGFRGDRGCRDQIANMRWIMETCKEF